MRPLVILASLVGALFYQTPVRKVAPLTTAKNTPSPPSDAHAPPVRPGNGPPSWPQTRLWGVMVGNDGLRSGTIGVEETVGVVGRGAAEAETWLASLAFGPPGERQREWLGR